MFTNLDHIRNPIVISADAVLYLEVVVMVGVACYPKEISLQLDFYELKTLF
jgi:hypothetical protein